jgi:stage II sporulation protein D
VIFEGKGYGHGVGLCQWSALQMARNGMNYKDILAFFYPGTTIEIHENL